MCNHLPLIIEDVTQDITTLSQQNPRYKAIKNIPSFGPLLTAAIVSEIGSGQPFQNGRQFSAWCGVVPKQNSTGGKVALELYQRVGTEI